MRLAFTSDLHIDSSTANRALPAPLARRCREVDPDVLAIAGDISARTHEFESTLQAFSEINCHKFVVPGNHDLWVESKSAILTGTDSGGKYRDQLPTIAAKSGFQFLHDRPIICGDIGLAGCMGWYDYSFRNRGFDPDATEEMYAKGIWTNPRTGKKHMWNDMQNVWWLKDHDARIKNFSRAEMCRSDREIATEMAQNLHRQLAELQEADVQSIVVVLHFVPTRKLLTYHNSPRDYWHAYQGSELIESVIFSCPLVSHIIFGHAHEIVDREIDGIRFLSSPIGYLDESPNVDLDELARERLRLIEV